METNLETYLQLTSEGLRITRQVITTGSKGGNIVTNLPTVTLPMDVVRRIRKLLCHAEGGNA